MTDFSALERATPAAKALGREAPRLAALLPILVAICGLTAIALSPRVGDAAPGIDPTVTGSITAAPLFQGGADAPR